MVKCIAPGAASHRGNKIEIAADGSCELSEEMLYEMRAHGFREWNGNNISAAVVVQPTLPSVATPEVEGMSRQKLMRALKGLVKGNLMRFSTDELKRLVHQSRRTEADDSKRPLPA
jgi:hypothetical protein